MVVLDLGRRNFPAAWRRHRQRETGRLFFPPLRSCKCSVVTSGESSFGEDARGCERIEAGREGDFGTARGVTDWRLARARWGTRGLTLSFVGSCLGRSVESCPGPREHAHLYRGQFMAQDAEKWSGKRDLATDAACIRPRGPSTGATSRGDRIPKRGGATCLRSRRSTILREQPAEAMPLDCHTVNRVSALVAA